MIELLPRIVSEVDPTRPYWPGSPYSGTRELHPNDPGHGTTHIWDVWNTDDYAKYRAYRPRFVAEFGFQTPPAYATLRRSLTPLNRARSRDRRGRGDAPTRRVGDIHGDRHPQPRPSRAHHPTGPALRE